MIVSLAARNEAVRPSVYLSGTEPDFMRTDLIRLYQSRDAPSARTADQGLAKSLPMRINSPRSPSTRYLPAISAAAPAISPRLIAIQTSDGV